MDDKLKNLLERADKRAALGRDWLRCNDPACCDKHRQRHRLDPESAEPLDAPNHYRIRCTGCGCVHTVDVKELVITSAD